MKVEIKGKTFNGSVTMFDRLYLPQVELVEAALLDVPEVDESNRVRFTALDKPKLPALIACVEKWELTNFPEAVTVDSFPLTPRKEAHALIDQIFVAIGKIYNGEMEVPNE